MFKKAIHFIKYNNATVAIVVIIFIFGATAFASETGRQAIGQKQTSIQGVDNTLLLEADLGMLDMDFKITKIQEDDKMYYVTYTYIDLIKKDNAWQYQMMEKARKISKKLDKDLGVYLAEELREQYEARVKELTKAQEDAKETGEEQRVEVTEYSGLIGLSLNMAGKVFSGYEPVKRKKIASPVKLVNYYDRRGTDADDNAETAPTTQVENLAQVYNNYIIENDPDADNVFGVNDNCPFIYNPEQVDSDNDGLGDLCDLTADDADDGATSTEDIVDAGEAAGNATSTEETGLNSPSEPARFEELGGANATSAPSDTIEEAVGDELAENDIQKTIDEKIADEEQIAEELEVEIVELTEVVSEEVVSEATSTPN